MTTDNKVTIQISEELASKLKDYFKITDESLNTCVEEALNLHVDLYASLIALRSSISETSEALNDLNSKSLISAVSCKKMYEGFAEVVATNVQSNSTLGDKVKSLQKESNTRINHKVSLGFSQQKVALSPKPAPTPPTTGKVIKNDLADGNSIHPDAQKALAKIRAKQNENTPPTVIHPSGVIGKEMQKQALNLPGKLI